MRRGDIVLADLEPARGSESSKQRPVVVVSNDGANERSTALGRGVVTVVPLSSNVARVLPFQVLITARDSGSRRDSKAQAEQVRSIDVTRVASVIGRVPRAQMLDVDEALRLHLSL